MVRCWQVCGASGERLSLDGMDPLLQPQLCSLRLPNRSDQARFERQSTVSWLFTALVPLILLIPIIGTPQDPEVPKFIGLLIAMELGIALLFKAGNWSHRTSLIYFDFHCSRCFRQLSWKLGSSRYGLDKRGAIRCGCQAVHSYECLNPQTVEVRPRTGEPRWIRAMARMVPRAWPNDEYRAAPRQRLDR
ncbi:MAG: hypothetical protein VKI83_12180 [Synechococcaceae cyanobacterium]|nr:hypothetical protein [Synechococcaceae cyanobacterium]